MPGNWAGAEAGSKSTLDLFDFHYTDIERLRREKAEYERETGCGCCGMQLAVFAIACLAATACLA